MQLDVFESVLKLIEMEYAGPFLVASISRVEPGGQGGAAEKGAWQIVAQQVRYAAFGCQAGQKSGIACSNSRFDTRMPRPFGRPETYVDCRIIRQCIGYPLDEYALPVGLRPWVGCGGEQDVRHLLRAGRLRGEGCLCRSGNLKFAPTPV